MPTTVTIAVNRDHPQSDIIERALEVLRRGGLVALPTETVYGLGAHALDVRALENIFTAKQRPHWDPLIVHVSGADMAERLTGNVPASFPKLAESFWPGPITFVLPRSSIVPNLVTAGRPTVALRMPQHPVALALLQAGNLPIAAPSANLFGRPSPTCAEHVRADLDGRVDLILDAGPTKFGVESTILDLTSPRPTILRPGGVTREEIEKVTGPVTILGAATGESTSRGLPAPGMTDKHYSPRAFIELFDAQVPGWRDRLDQRSGNLKASGIHHGIILSGGDLNGMARDLFSQMRRCDSENATIILCELPPPAGIGLAIRDRLLRAAGRGNQT
jgi:L-threonylcarbamoyladenylate synthase